MMDQNPQDKEYPLDIVGGSTYGRDPKVLACRTFNMIVSDSWLLDYAGYKYLLSLDANGKGRGIFTSIPGQRIIVVVKSAVFSVTVIPISQSEQKFYELNFVGFLDSLSGDVFISENNVGQIAICDQSYIYIYNYKTFSFQKALLPEGVRPGYIEYQNGRFITVDLNSSIWLLSQVGDGLDWFWGASGEPVFGAVQTKGDLAKAAIRMPGRGNMLLVMGNIVTEVWTDTGRSTFPYERSTTMNIDYGVVNSATIASSDEIVAWLGINEKSGPTILYSTGGNVKQVSTDGINYRLSKLVHPEKSCAFFIKLSGHLCYHITFYSPEDNFSMIYDFTTEMFSDVSDENMDYYVARRVAFFGNTYYFVSLNDGNLYEMSADLFTFDYGSKVEEIPRIRVCKNIRLKNSTRFIVNSISFTLEQGSDELNVVNQTSYQPRIALCLSRNGGVSFGSFSTRDLNKIGKRLNKLNWWNLGQANDFVAQIRFWGKGPWRATDGSASIYQ